MNGGEAKADEGDGSQGGEGENGAEADPVPEGDYELELPEGVTLDAELLGEATPILKEAGLGSKAASKFVPLVEKIQAQTAEAVQKQIVDTHQTTIADWTKETLADPELGGRNWTQTQENVARALDSFVGPKEIEVEVDGKMVKQPQPFRQLLDETGIGNNIHLIRAFAAIGKAMGEETNFARASAGGSAPKSRAEQLYPNQVPKQS
jgi:hypothetical protein